MFKFKLIEDDMDIKVIKTYANNLKIEIAKEAFPKGVKVKIALSEDSEKEILTLEECINALSKDELKEAKIANSLGTEWVVVNGKYKVSDFDMPCIGVKNKNGDSFFVTISNIIEKE